MIIDGKKEAANLREEIKNEILEIKKKDKQKSQFNCYFDR
jgi:5,10-methylene-tetrahydrofolate dehydrogenase/methenyl tetrahydrofolate cyclohydrolase